MQEMEVIIRLLHFLNRAIFHRAYIFTLRLFVSIHEPDPLFDNHF